MKNVTTSNQPERAAGIEKVFKLKTGELRAASLEALGDFDFSSWRELNPASENGTLCFETRGTPVHVQIEGQWRGGANEPYVGLSGNPNKSANGMAHMCLMFIFEWFDGLQWYRDVQQGISDSYDFIVDNETLPENQQARLILRANDFKGQFGDNANNPNDPAKYRVETL